MRSRAAALPRPRASAVIDTLLYGRGWIALVFVLLAGIVFFNVDLLRMNRGIALTAEKSASVKRDNARLRAEVARLGSSERIQEAAMKAGLVLPAPGEVRYLASNPAADPRNAVKRLAEGGEATAVTSAPPVGAIALPAEPVVPATAPEPTTDPNAIAEAPAPAPVTAEPAEAAPPVTTEPAQPTAPAPTPDVAGGAPVVPAE